MTLRRNTFKHPRKAPSKFRLRHFLFLLVLALTLFFLLEKLRSSYRKPEQQQPPAAVQKMPQRDTVDYAQKHYTSAHISPPVRSHQPASGEHHGSVAIVVDDMGSSMKEVQELVAINLPLTFAVIPGLSRAKSVAEFAHAKGRDVILHIPMEPQGFPQQRVEGNALLMSDSAAAIEGRLRGFIREIPFVIGANNHMGSRLTEHDEQMVPVMTVLKEKGLFFLDSRTSPRSVGQEVAGRFGVKTGSRNIFLDNEQNVATIKKELAAAARMAGRRGSVIAICHPHPATIQALKEMMPVLAQEGTQFVNVAALLK